MRTVDLFAGCGGLSLGFQNAGFDIISAFDYWIPAIEVYKENFQHPIYKQDLSTHEAYTPVANFNPEIIIGGPPCQDFSSAGKRDESFGRADLTLKFANIVSCVKPQWFVMENVERIVKKRSFKNGYKNIQAKWVWFNFFNFECKLLWGSAI